MSNVPSNNEEIRVKETRPIKLKGQPGRDMLPLDFIRDFGFIPERIIVRAQQGKVAYISVAVVLTEEEAKKEDKELAKRKKNQGKMRKEHDAEIKRIAKIVKKDNESKKAKKEVKENG